jgi:S1-C subfamily serine protease
MFNMAGEVIGIVSHNISKSGGSEGLGFVVTINTAKKLLLEEGSFWIGLEGRLLSDELADLLNLPPNAVGYLVKTVAKGSPGEAVGLRGGTKVAVIDGEQIVLGGDIIMKVQGVPVRGLTNYEQIRKVLAALPSGGNLTVTVLRAGQVIVNQGATLQREREEQTTRPFAIGDMQRRRGSSCLRRRLPTSDARGSVDRPCGKNDHLDTFGRTRLPFRLPSDP